MTFIHFYFILVALLSLLVQNRNLIRCSFSHISILLKHANIII
jgi:hypothetical protein